MTIPSHVLASGSSPQMAQTIAGAGQTGLVATGSTQATALQLPASYNAITTSAASTGVKLPPIEQGASVEIWNNSGQTITIYPFETSGVTFNNGATTLSLASAKSISLRAYSSQLWVSNLSA